MIREMRIDDVIRVYEIDQNDLKSNWSENLYRFELIDINTRAFVYEEDEKLLGFIIAKYIGDTSDLLQIAVDKAHKQMKIGKKLLNYCIDHLKKEGVKEMILEVGAENSEAIRFYKGFKFEYVHLRRNYYGRGKDAILMKLRMR